MFKIQYFFKVAVSLLAAILVFNLVAYSQTDTQPEGLAKLSNQPRRYNNGIIEFKFKSDIANDTTVLRFFFKRLSSGGMVIYDSIASSFFEIGKKTSLYYNLHDSTSLKIRRDYVNNYTSKLYFLDNVSKVFERKNIIVSKDSFNISVLDKQNFESYDFSTKTGLLKKYVRRVFSIYGVQYESLSFYEAEVEYNFDFIKNFKSTSPKNKKEMVLSVGMKLNLPEVKDIKGYTYMFTTTEKRMLLIEMFYQSCLPCVKSIPILNKINEELKDKVQVIGVSMVLGDTINMDKFITRWKIQYPVIYGKEAQKIWQIVKNTSAPYTILLDERKTIVKIFDGVRDDLYDEVSSSVKHY